MEGERNTRFFHAAVKRKHARLKINTISSSSVTLTEQVQIKESVVEYFTNIFSEEQVLSLDPCLDVFNALSQLTEDMNITLNTAPSMDELKKVVFDLKGDAAAGPDGYSAHFFQSCWNIINIDLLAAVQSFFNGDIIP